MFRAYLTHIVLLLVLRHPGRGLPYHWQPVLVLIVLAAVSAAMRWAVLYDTVLFSPLLELFVIALAMLLCLSLLAQISPRFAAAFALVAVGTDVVSLALYAFGLLGDLARAALLFIQAIALARIAAILYLRARVEHRE